MVISEGTISGNKFLYQDIIRIIRKFKPHCFLCFTSWLILLLRKLFLLLLLPGLLRLALSCWSGKLHWRWILLEHSQSQSQWSKTSIRRKDCTSGRVQHKIVNRFEYYWTIFPSHNRSKNRDKCYSPCSLQLGVRIFSLFFFFGYVS